MRTYPLLIVFILVVLNVSGHYRRRCHKTCNTQFGIVCGSDGRTYWNECALNNAICQDKTGKLKKVTNGPCKGLYTSFVNGLSYEPVCGSDGKTYSNVVYMKIEACLTKKPIKITRRGKCDCRFYRCKSRPSCDNGCPKVSSSICGSDGKFYINKCILDKANCLLGNKIRIQYKGACENIFKSIPGIPPFKPVCGSDGITYSTSEHLDVAACQDSSLRKLYDGYCR